MPEFIGSPAACALLLRFSVVVGMLASAALPARAADAPPYPLLLREALDRAPLLREQAANVRAAGADAEQSQAWPNPRLDVVSENVGAPAAEGLSQRQDTYTLAQPFELGGKRGSRIEAARRSFAAAQARDRGTRVEFAAELAIAYAAAEAAQAKRVLAADDSVRANDDLRAAQALVHAGKEASLRVAQAQASVAAAQAAEQAAAADAAQALEHLAAMVGASEAYSGLSASLLEASATESANTAAHAVDAPSVASAAAERDVLDAQLRVEEKKWIPDLDVSAGMRRYGWTDERGWVIGVSATIPLFDRNSRGVDAARARVQAADERLAAARLEANARHRAALAQVATTAKRLAAATAGERAAAEAYRLGRIAYDAGKTSLTELLLIRRALTDAKATTIDARLARVQALAGYAQTEGRIAFGE